jgi:Cu/Ag efflux protein CusF
LHLHRKSLIVRRPAQSRAFERTRVVVVLCVVALAILAGAILYIQMRAPNPSPAQPSLGPADQQYTLDGRIERLPTERTPVIHIRHDDIPDFVDKDGQIVGMRAMSMPFDVAPDVDLTGLAPGDLVTFTFEVRWRESPNTLVTRLDRRTQTNDP